MSDLRLCVIGECTDMRSQFVTMAWNPARRGKRSRKLSNDPTPRYSMRSLISVILGGTEKRSPVSRGTRILNQMVERLGGQQESVAAGPSPKLMVIILTKSIVTRVNLVSVLGNMASEVGLKGAGKLRSSSVKDWGKALCHAIPKASKLGNEMEDGPLIDSRQGGIAARSSGVKFVGNERKWPMRRVRGSDRSDSIVPSDLKPLSSVKLGRESVERDLASRVANCCVTKLRDVSPTGNCEKS